MKCKNCGKELTGKKEFCDDNKGNVTEIIKRNNLLKLMVVKNCLK